VNHRPGRPDPRQESAFNHEDVVGIIDDLVANPDLRLLKLADSLSLIREAMSEQEVRDFIGFSLLTDVNLGLVAVRVGNKARGIATAASRDDRVRRRGALLERLVHKLVEVRLPTQTHHEHQVELTHNPRSRRQWTGAKEIVADGAEFEVYECKSDGLPDIADIDELSDVRTTALAEGTDARPTIVTFGSEGSLRIQAKAWRLTETIYGVTIDRILGLASDPPGKPIQPAP
jgi:hypothetical protein